MALLVLLAPCPGAAQRRTPSFDRGWHFHLGDLVGAQEVAFDDSGWRTLDVPPDWRIEGELNDTTPAGVGGSWLTARVGWYCKQFFAAAADSGQAVFVEFDGVCRKSEAWI